MKHRGIKTAAYIRTSRILPLFTTEWRWLAPPRPVGPTVIRKFDWPLLVLGVRWGRHSIWTGLSRRLAGALRWVSCSTLDVWWIATWGYLDESLRGPLGILQGMLAFLRGSLWKWSRSAQFKSHYFSLWCRMGWAITITIIFSLLIGSIATSLSGKWSRRERWYSWGRFLGLVLRRK